MFFVIPPRFSSDYSTRRRHLRVSHRTNRGPGHHCPARASGRSRGCFVLADGLQENAERQRSTAASDSSAESDVHESRPDVFRTVTGLPDMRIIQRRLRRRRFLFFPSSLTYNFYYFTLKKKKKIVIPYHPLPHITVGS